MTTFFIADQHFGHRNILEYEAEARPYGSIEEHDEDLIEQWNAVVRPQDTVWCLGDFAFGRAALERTGPRLRGHRRLVLGNHDRLPSRAYLEHGFAQLLGCARYQSVLLSHIPVDIGQSARFGANLHGHLHSLPSPTPWHVSVSVEANRRRTGRPRPVAWEELADEVAAAQAVATAWRTAGQTGPADNGSNRDGPVPTEGRRAATSTTGRRPTLAEIAAGLTITPDHEHPARATFATVSTLGITIGTLRANHQNDEFASPRGDHWTAEADLARIVPGAEDSVGATLDDWRRGIASYVRKGLCYLDHIVQVSNETDPN